MSIPGYNVHEFLCPECKRPCRFSEKQRALQHSDPTCKTWRAHKGNAQEFLRLALMAAKGNLVLGAVGAAERTVDEGKPDTPEQKKERERVLEQLYEGLKKL